MHWRSPNCLDGPLSRRLGRWPFQTCGPASTLADSLNSGTLAHPELACAIRRELVERIRLQIAAGVYDTPEKWDAALLELARRLSHD